MKWDKIVRDEGEVFFQFLCLESPDLSLVFPEAVCLSVCLSVFCLKCSDISLPWKSHIISKPFPPGGAILVAKVVPESCQRTDGIDAWLDIKADKEAKRMEKEEKRRDRKESLQPTLIVGLFSWQCRYLYLSQFLYLQWWGLVIGVEKSYSLK